MANTLMINTLALMDALAARGGLVGMETSRRPRCFSVLFHLEYRRDAQQDFETTLRTSLT